MPKKSFYLLALIMFLTMTGYGVILPSLPYLATRLGLSSLQMGSLITGWALAQFIVVPFWGRLIDQIGCKPVLLIGLFGFGLAFLLMIFAKSYLQLLVIRIIGAIVSSGTQPAALALVTNSFRREERGKRISQMAAANGLGFLCGPMVGGMFSPIGIEAPFVAAGIFSILTVPLVFFFLKEANQQTQSKRNPSLKESLSILAKPGYSGLFLITFGLAFSASSLFGVLGYFMIDKFSSSARETGIGFSSQSLAAVVVQLFFMGAIFQRFREKGISITGLIIESLGFVLIGVSFSIWMVYLGCVLVGAGQSVVRPTLLALLSKQNLVGQGTVMGLQQAVDSLGRSVGPLFAGWIFHFSSRAPFLSSFTICMILFLCVLVDSSWKSREVEAKNEYLV